MTSTSYTGFIGGLTSADSICNSRAQAAGLGGTWKAWMSDGLNDAISRITDVSPWYLVDKTTQVFPTKASITSTGPAVAINMTEMGAAAPFNNVWTGTTSGGTKSTNNCQSWSSSSNRKTGDIGTVTTGATWTQNNFLTCSLGAAIYCFEQ